MAGTYVLYAGFERTSGQEVVARSELTVGNASGSGTLSERREPVTAAPDVRVALVGGDGVRAGRKHTLTFRLEDPRGEPVVLDAIPGRPAHVGVLNSSANESSTRMAWFPVAQSRRAWRDGRRRASLWSRIEFAAHVGS